MSCCANQPAWLSFMAHTTDKLADMRRYEDTAHVREQYGLSLGSYGRARMTMELQEAGLDVGERRVGKLMRINGIKTVRSARKNGPGGLYLTH